MLARHLHGLGSGDDPLISYTGANASYLDAEYLYTDRLGSVIARYRRDGTPAAINGYDEYGVPGPSSGVNNNGRFRYTGQVWLPELGLYYYKARMYSPTIGRFMQTDPIGYADGMNMYAYVGNDPVNGVDPTGLAIRTTKECTGTRLRRAFSYDCNAMFAGTGPMPNPNAGFDATLGGGGSGVGGSGGGGRGGSTASCSGGLGNVINVCGSPNRGFAANNIGDHLGFAGTQNGLATPQSGEQPASDICGSPGNSQNIPEGMSATSFQGACRKHDRCYGTLGNTQEQCDQRLGQDILDECKIRGGWLCSLSAYVYYRALAGIPGIISPGKAAYENAQNAARLRLRGGIRP